MNIDKNRIACILNYPSFYREEIYRLMEKELDCDYFFGGSTSDGKIKKLDYNTFKKSIMDLRTIKIISHFYWISGSVPLVFKKYDTFILTGEPYCVSAWIILLLAKLLGKKVFLWGHGWYGDETSVKRVIKYYFHKLASGVFLYGNYAKELMIKEGFPESKLHVIYNSLSYSEQLNIRSSIQADNIYFNHFENNYPNLIFIGRLTPQKKLHQILEALALINKEVPKMNITYIGDGDEKENLIKLTKSLRLEKNGWFYGESFDEKELSKLIYNADLCVSPGNVGLTAIHSMMYGTPVITHNNYANQMPEFEAIEEGLTGSFFQENDPVALANCLNEWFCKNTDRETIRKNCFHIIDYIYNPSKQIQLLIKVLQNNT